MFKTKEAIYNFIYSIGAAIVIIGALFKLTHFSIGPLTGNVTLAIGLITEAIIFVISHSMLQNQKNLTLGKMFIQNY